MSAQAQIPTAPTKQVGELLRSAWAKVSRPALWKRRRELRMCETLSLGNRNFVAVIGYQDRRFLVGGTPTAISLLADVTDHEVQCADDAD